MVIRVALVNDDEVVVRGLDAMLRSYNHRVEVVELVAGKPVSQPVDVALYDTFGMGQGNGDAVKRLVDAIGAIAAGQVVVSPSRGRSALVGGDWPGREEGLTAREAEVLALITQGLSNVDIATRTSLSINSIKSYIRSCYRKIGVSSRSQAVLWGATHGFLPDRVRVTDPD